MSTPVIPLLERWRASGREVAVVGLGKSGTAATLLLRDHRIPTYASDTGTGPAFDSSVVRSTPELRKVHWVEPELVAMIEHRQLTAAGRLRAPAFKGFREDKSPRECTIDQLATETTAG